MVISWVPEALWPWILVVKALLALAATVLLVVHMMQRADSVGGAGQRLRYWALLAASVLITAASGEQATELAADDFELAYRHLGSLIVSALILTAAVASLREGPNPPDGELRRTRPAKPPPH
jgi:hypothetical protein